MSAHILGRINPNWPQIQLLATVAIPMFVASCVPAASANRLVPEGSIVDLPTSSADLAIDEPSDPAARAEISLRASQWLAPVSADPASPFDDTANSAEDQQRSLNCLTAAIYYEARSEPEEGQRAVAQVVLNRVRHPAFPSTVCGVVFQGSQRRTGCQFSFTCDGSMRFRRDVMAWIRSRRIAEEALHGYVYAAVGNATHYHTTAIMPYWAHSLRKSAIVGAHVFYRWAGSAGEAGAFHQRYGGLEPTPALWSGTSVAAQGVAVHRGSPEAPGNPRVWREEIAVDNGEGSVTVHRGGGLPGPGYAEEATGEADDFGVKIHTG